MSQAVEVDVSALIGWCLELRDERAKVGGTTAYL